MRFNHKTVGYMLVRVLRIKYYRLGDGVSYLCLIYSACFMLLLDYDFLRCLIKLSVIYYHIDISYLIINYSINLYIF